VRRTYKQLKQGDPQHGAGGEAEAERQQQHHLVDTNISDTHRANHARST
jgi:hypothetical protein